MLRWLRRQKLLASLRLAMRWEEMAARLHGHRYYHFDVQFDDPELDCGTQRCLPVGSHVNYAQYTILRVDHPKAHTCKVSDWRGEQLATVITAHLPSLRIVE
jgi:hypothetical protein